MVRYKRAGLLSLMTLTSMFLAYQLALILYPWNPHRIQEIKYLQLVDKYEVIKMQRLVLREQEALAKTRNNIMAAYGNIPTQQIALSLEQSKTFEQLEAYVSGKQLPPLAKNADEKFLLGCEPTHFTLQLMGVRDKAELSRFIVDNKLQDAHIFHTYYLNKDWYVLVCGNYKSHGEALKAIDTLQANIKDLKPWIRQISSVQKAIQLYR